MRLPDAIMLMPTIILFLLENLQPIHSTSFPTITTFTVKVPGPFQSSKQQLATIYTTNPIINIINPPTLPTITVKTNSTATLVTQMTTMYFAIEQRDASSSTDTYVCFSDATDTHSTKHELIFTQTKTSATTKGNTPFWPCNGRDTLCNLQHPFSIIYYLSHNKLYTKDWGTCSTDPGVFPLCLHKHVPVRIPSEHARVSMRRAHNYRCDYLKLVQTYYCFRRLAYARQ